MPLGHAPRNQRHRSHSRRSNDHIKQSVASLLLRQADSSPRLHGQPPSHQRRPPLRQPSLCTVHLRADAQTPRLGSIPVLIAHSSMGIGPKPSPSACVPHATVDIPTKGSRPPSDMHWSGDCKRVGSATAAITALIRFNITIKMACLTVGWRQQVNFHQPSRSMLKGRAQISGLQYNI